MGPRHGNVPVDTYEWEFNILLEVFKDINPYNSLEIGTYYGASLRQWILNGPEFGTIVCIDDTRLIKEYWQDDKHFEIYLVKSTVEDDEVKRFIKDKGPYDFAFLNGSRKYHLALLDWEIALENMKESSVIAIHNIVENKRNGVNMLWRQIQKKGFVTQEVVAENSTKGIGIVYL